MHGKAKEFLCLLLLCYITLLFHPLPYGTFPYNYVTSHQNTVLVYITHCYCLLQYAYAEIGSSMILGIAFSSVFYFNCVLKRVYFLFKLKTRRSFSCLHRAPTTVRKWTASSLLKTSWSFRSEWPTIAQGCCPSKRSVFPASVSWRLSTKV